MNTNTTITAPAAAQAPASSIVRLQGVSKIYGSGDAQVRALDDVSVGFGPGDVAPDPDGRFPGGSREVAHAERIVPGPGRQRRCGRIGGVFGGVVAARSGEQREDQQKE